MEEKEDETDESVAVVSGARNKSCQWRHPDICRLNAPGQTKLRKTVHS